MVQNASEQVQHHHAALRAAGLKPIEIWIPDSSRDGFADECARQARLAAAADRKDDGLADDLDAALRDLDGWTA